MAGNEKYLPDIKIFRLKKNWIEIIGEQLSTHTKPVKIYSSTLVIHCDHQGWINTLQFYKQDILNNISNIFKNEINVNDIKFVYRNTRSN